MEGIIYGEQMSLAENAAGLQHEQIRNEQTQLRLQEGQDDIARLTQLNQVLATEAVQMGVRNISPGSGSVNAIVQQNFTDFLSDETASKLNYAAKQSALGVEQQEVDVKKDASYLDATSGFLSNIEKEIASAMSGGAGSGGASYAASSDQNLADFSAGNNMNLNG